MKPTDEQSRHNLMSYYYEFATTGVDAIDRLLAAVARAGKAYHHTQNWNEPDLDGPTPVEKIQAAADAAAVLVRDLEAVMPGEPAHPAPEPGEAEGSSPLLYGYARVMDVFDKDATARRFLRDDGDGGFASGVYRMAEHIRRLERAAAPEPGEVERLREAHDAAVEIAETIYHNPAGSLWNHGTTPTAKDRAEWKGARDAALEILQYLDPERAPAALAEGESHE